MEVNGTEVGMGVGAFFASVMAYLKLKPKPEDDMSDITRRITKLEGGYRRLGDTIKHMAELNAINMAAASSDISDVKQDLHDLKNIMMDVRQSTARLEGAYAATAERHS